MIRSNDSPDFSPDAPVVRLACDAMGTRFEIVLMGDDQVHLRAAGEIALAEVRHWHERLSFFEQASFVSYLNARAANHAVPCDGEMFQLLSLCQQVWAGSGGVFDPTVAALMRAAGFRGERRDPVAMKLALASTGFQHVQLDETARTVRFLRPGIGLDLGAVGKGWALDRAAMLLKEARITQALIHGGTSSVLTIGAPHDRDAWPVALRNPVEGGPTPIVSLRDQALGVSAPHGRQLEVADHPDLPAGHVLDPRSGESASTAVAAVIADSAALADAWSTALLVTGSRPTGIPDDLTTLVGTRHSDGPLEWAVAGPGSALVYVPNRGNR